MWRWRLRPCFALAPPAARAAAIEPLSPDRFKLELTIAGDTAEKLRLAKDMLAGVVPSDDDAAIIDRALTVLLEDLAKKKFAATRKPRPSRGTKPGARHIAAAVKRAVWMRDLGRCAFVGTSGHRCNERRFLQFHHLDPHALGGEATRRSDRPSVPASQRLRGAVVLRPAQARGR